MNEQENSSFGQLGMGMTYSIEFLKKMIEENGGSIIVFDPKAELVMLEEAMKGEVIECG